MDTPQSSFATCSNQASKLDALVNSLKLTGITSLTAFSILETLQMHFFIC